MTKKRRAEGSSVLDIGGNAERSSNAWGKCPGDHHDQAMPL
jgi:hypothetical protein